MLHEEVVKLMPLSAKRSESQLLVPQPLYLCLGVGTKVSVRVINAFVA